MLIPHAVSPRHSAGFSVVELLVVLSVVGILAAVAGPGMAAWVRDSRLTAASESLANGLRMAREEAIRRSHGVVFTTTNDTPGLASAAVAGGRNWALYQIPRATETLDYLRGGSLLEGGAGTTVTGPAAVCFNSLGRRVANAATGVAAATCEIGADPMFATYTVTQADSSRSVRITISLNGQVRSCDPAAAGGTVNACP